MVTTHKNSVKYKTSSKNCNGKNKPVRKSSNNKNSNPNKSKNPKPNVYKTSKKSKSKNDYKSDDITFHYYLKNEDKRLENGNNHMRSFYNIVKNEKIIYLGIKSINNNLNSFNKQQSSKEKMLYTKSSKKQYHQIINNLKNSVSNMNFKNYRLFSIPKENYDHKTKYYKTKTHG